MSDPIVSEMSCRYLDCPAKGAATTRIHEKIGKVEGASVDHAKGWKLDSKSDHPIVPSHGWCPSHASHPRLSVLSATDREVRLAITPEVRADLELDAFEGPRPKLEDAIRGIGFDPDEFDVRQEESPTAFDLRLVRR
jgi:hypothetical protein